MSARGSKRRAVGLDALTDLGIAEFYDVVSAALAAVAEAHWRLAAADRYPQSAKDYEAGAEWLLRRALNHLDFARGLVCRNDPARGLG